jgi:Cu+-exporting ATPase
MAAVVRRALIERAPIATLAERIAARFVPAVIALAAATAVGWWLAGAGAATAVGRALATIVVSCPCALALATPAALVAGTSAALARGIVLKEAGVLEALAAVRAVQFDKTGTLTAGELVAGAPLPLVAGTRDLDDGERAMLRALAAGSRHAAARAVAATLARAPECASGVVAPDLAPLLAIEEQAGLGVRARHADREWKLGRLAFAAPGFDATTLAVPDDAALVACSIDGKLRAAWPLRDELKPTARAAIDAMRARGLAVEMVTGDRLAAAQAVGRALGLAPDAIHAEQTPAGKAALVQQRQAAGTPLLFVGDGFNDGAALAVAAVGAACGERRATDLARAAGRMVLLRGDPQDAVVALDLARATMRIVRQNLFLAVAYNAVALPWAMGLLSRFGIDAPEPAHAGLAMAASSLAVVLNALRLARK